MTVVGPRTAGLRVGRPSPRKLGSRDGIPAKFTAEDSDATAAAVTVTATESLARPPRPGATTAVTLIGLGPVAPDRRIHRRILRDSEPEGPDLVGGTPAARADPADTGNNLKRRVLPAGTAGPGIGRPRT
jgi:hypothetical protein